MESLALAAPLPSLIFLRALRVFLLSLNRYSPNASGLDIQRLGPSPQAGQIQG